MDKIVGLCKRRGFVRRSPSGSLGAYANDAPAAARRARRIAFVAADGFSPGRRPQFPSVTTRS
jgi:hypothetical protein